MKASRCPNTHGAMVLTPAPGSRLAEKRLMSIYSVPPYCERSTPVVTTAGSSRFCRHISLYHHPSVTFARQNIATARL